MESRIQLTGQLNPCRCGKQPNMIFTSAGNKYYMECSPCGIKLWKFDSAQACVQHWEDLPQLHIETPPEGG